ncbi:MAG: ATP synthase subunit I [Deltaproteobacteria bacterium]|nr:ATP synthase subunit I [Deltaproteobacteria bacterium]
MIIQKRLLKFILNANWILFALAVCAGLLTESPEFTMGIICGGLITTINFHLLYKTLKQSLTPPHLSSHRVVLFKYYIRFTATAIIIGILISGKYVNPLGLFVGLSVVVASIMLATFRELTILIFKEAV